jgi:hypothetical protein
MTGMDAVEKQVEAFNARDLDVSTTTAAVGKQ